MHLTVLTLITHRQALLLTRVSGSFWLVSSSSPSSLVRSVWSRDTEWLLNSARRNICNDSGTRIKVLILLWLALWMSYQYITTVTGLFLKTCRGLVPLHETKSVNHAGVSPLYWRTCDPGSWQYTRVFILHQYVLMHSQSYYFGWKRQPRWTSICQMAPCKAVKQLAITITYQGAEGKYCTLVYYDGSWHTRVPQNRGGHALLHTMTQEDLILSININPVLSGIITATLPWSAIFVSAEIIVQKAKLQALNGLVFCFWFGILGTVISLLGSLALEDMTLPPDINDMITMAGGHCLIAAFVSISSFYTHKYMYASCDVVSLSTSTQLFFMFLGQSLLFEKVCLRIEVLTWNMWGNINHISIGSAPREINSIQEDSNKCFVKKYTVHSKCICV